MNLVHRFNLWATTDTRTAARFEGEVRAETHAAAEQLARAKASEMGCGYFHVELSGLRFEEGEAEVLRCDRASEASISGV